MVLSMIVFFSSLIECMKVSEVRLNFQQQYQQSKLCSIYVVTYHSPTNRKYIHLSHTTLVTQSILQRTAQRTTPIVFDIGGLVCHEPSPLTHPRHWYHAGDFVLSQQL